MGDLTAFFDTLAVRWDAMQSPARDAHLARILTPHTARFAGVQRVLDVGTGTGAFLPHLHRLAPDAQVVALDLSPVMLARAQASGRARGVCCWLRGDAHRVPLARGTVDLVTCHDSFAHFEDRPAALREFFRVLRPGGQLVILHDVPRQRVNEIHGSAEHPRIQTHTLPPVDAVVPVVEGAGFAVLAAEDTAEYYLITARQR